MHSIGRHWMLILRQCGHSPIRGKDATERKYHLKVESWPKLKSQAGTSMRIRWSPRQCRLKLKNLHNGLGLLWNWLHKITNSWTFVNALLFSVCKSWIFYYFTSQAEQAHQKFAKYTSVFCILYCHHWTLLENGHVSCGFTTLHLLLKCISASALVNKFNWGMLIYWWSIAMNLVISFFFTNQDFRLLLQNNCSLFYT